jgi:serine/threonine-protein phosphatase 2A regulatory subunit B'
LEGFSPSLDRKLASFREVPSAERPLLLAKKLRQAALPVPVPVNLGASPELPAAVQRLVDVKRQTLIEILDYVNGTKGAFQEPLFGEFIAMVSANIFRALPKPSADSPLFDPDEDEPVLDPQWAHRQFVYELLLRFVISPDVDPRAAKKVLGHEFVLGIISLFRSDDPRERDYLKTTLHRIYAKFMAHRAFIRRMLRCTLTEFAQSGEHHPGVAELLEILGSIINGFALPLKTEHREFLVAVLLPLHRVRYLTLFHSQLAYCVGQYIEKDAFLAGDVLSGLSRYWPRVDSSKEVLFLSEVEEILELTPSDALGDVAETLFARIARSVGSPHFQVAERALSLISNEYVLAHLVAHKATVMPLLFPPLCNNTRDHWNQNVLSLTYNALKALMDIDSALFSRCADAYKVRSQADNQVVDKRRAFWAQVHDLAAAQGKKEQLNPAFVAGMLARLDIVAADPLHPFRFARDTYTDVHVEVPGLAPPGSAQAGQADSSQEAETPIPAQPAPRIRTRVRRKSILPTSVKHAPPAFSGYPSGPQ